MTIKTCKYKLMGEKERWRIVTRIVARIVSSAEIFCADCAPYCILRVKNASVCIRVAARTKLCILEFELRERTNERTIENGPGQVL